MYSLSTDVYGIIYFSIPLLSPMLSAFFKEAFSNTEYLLPNDITINE